ncbi:hypothetical protein PoB_005899700 [Plakobranchus ocellatus]|uniref:HTH La-type RNA-binding domain-containing protein n=1 Tax=Plakobranchus ocellatus TaxID=259542 RepID=A0AAV4CLR9_9GAST|nr:hypothetical protein PoB_005899700 [Plakobranchus ocellatus]
MPVFNFEGQACVVLKQTKHKQQQQQHHPPSSPPPDNTTFDCFDSFCMSSACSVVILVAPAIRDNSVVFRSHLHPHLPSRIPPNRHQSAGRGRWPVVSLPNGDPWLFPFPAIFEPRGIADCARAFKTRLRHPRRRYRLNHTPFDDYSYFRRYFTDAEEEENLWQSSHAVPDQEPRFSSPPRNEACIFCSCSGRGVRGPRNRYAQSVPACEELSDEYDAESSLLFPINLPSLTLDPGTSWLPTLEASPSSYYDHVEEGEEEQEEGALPLEILYGETSSCGDVFDCFLEDDHEYVDLEDLDSPQVLPPVLHAPLYDSCHIDLLPGDISNNVVLPQYDDNFSSPGEILVEVSDKDFATVTIGGIGALSEESFHVDDDACVYGYNSDSLPDEALPSSTHPTSTIPEWLPLQPGDVYFYAPNSSVVCVHTDDLETLAGKAPTSIQNSATSTVELQSPEASQVSPRNLNPAAPAFHQLAPASPKNLNPSAPVFRQSQPSGEKAPSDAANFAAVAPVVEGTTTGDSGGRVEGDTVYLPNGGVEGLSLDDRTSVDDSVSTTSGGELAGGGTEEQINEQQQQQQQQQQVVQEGHKYSDEMLAPVIKQMHYYFSSENLPNDKFLNGHMDSDKYIPLDLFLDFGRIKPICRNLEMLTQAVEASSVLELNETRDKVRVSQCRKTLTLRGFPGSPLVTEAEVKQFVLDIGAEMPTRIELVMVKDKLSTWYVSFRDMNAALNSFSMFHNKQAVYKGHTIGCCIKSSGTLGGSGYYPTPTPTATSEEHQHHPHQQRRMVVGGVVPHTQTSAASAISTVTVTAPVPAHTVVPTTPSPMPQQPQQQQQQHQQQLQQQAVAAAAAAMLPHYQAMQLHPSFVSGSPTGIYYQQVGQSSPSYMPYMPNMLAQGWPGAPTAMDPGIIMQSNGLQPQQIRSTPMPRPHLMPSGGGGPQHRFTRPQRMNRPNNSIDRSVSDRGSDRQAPVVSVASLGGARSSPSTTTGYMHHNQHQHHHHPHQHQQQHRVGGSSGSSVRDEVASAVMNVSAVSQVVSAQPQQQYVPPLVSQHQLQQHQQQPHAAITTTTVTPALDSSVSHYQHHSQHPGNSGGAQAMMPQAAAAPSSSSTSSSHTAVPGLTPHASAGSGGNSNGISQPQIHHMAHHHSQHHQQQQQQQQQHHHSQPPPPLPHHQNHQATQPSSHHHPPHHQHQHHHHQNQQHHHHHHHPHPQQQHHQQPPHLQHNQPPPSQQSHHHHHHHQHQHPHHQQQHHHHHHHHQHQHHNMLQQPPPLHSQHHQQMPPPPPHHQHHQQHQALSAGRTDKKNRRRREDMMRNQRERGQSNRANFSSQVPPTTDNFTMEANSFPPLPGAAGNIANSEVSHENRLSDVVRGLPRVQGGIGSVGSVSAATTTGVPRGPSSTPSPVATPSIVAAPAQPHHHIHQHNQRGQSIQQADSDTSGALDDADTASSSQEDVEADGGTGDVSAVSGASDARTCIGGRSDVSQSSEPHTQLAMSRSHKSSTSGVAATGSNRSSEPRHGLASSSLSSGVPNHQGAKPAQPATQSPLLSPTTLASAEAPKLSYAQIAQKNREAANNAAVVSGGDSVVTAAQAVQASQTMAGQTSSSTSTAPTQNGPSPTVSAHQFSGNALPSSRTNSGNNSYSQSPNHGFQRDHSGGSYRQNQHRGGSAGPVKDGGFQGSPLYQRPPNNNSVNHNNNNNNRRNANKDKITSVNINNKFDRRKPEARQK